MFRIGRTLQNQSINFAKQFINISRNFQVTVVGASRPLGQSVSLLLKQHPLIHRLHMFDFPEETRGVVTDLSHIPREPLVEGWTDRMENALSGSDLVIVTGGQQRQFGQRDLCLFRENADFVITAMHEIIEHCPQAFIAIVTEPINYTVPLASKVLKSADAYDKCKVFGVTGLDTMRTQACISSMYQVSPNVIRVPVVCGHSSKTILPLLSHITPRFDIDSNTALTITEDVRKIDDHVTSLMCGHGASMLSTAYATYCTAAAILDAMNGFAIEHVAFVANNEYGTKFFASPCIITWQGISAIMELKFLNELESNYLYRSAEQLADEVRSGELYYIPTYFSTVKDKQNQM